MKICLRARLLAYRGKVSKQVGSELLPCAVILLRTVESGQGDRGKGGEWFWDFFLDKVWAGGRLTTRLEYAMCDERTVGICFEADLCTERGPAWIRFVLDITPFHPFDRSLRTGPWLVTLLKHDCTSPISLYSNLVLDILS